MKKRILLLGMAIIVILILFTACYSAPEPVPTEKPTFTPDPGPPTLKSLGFYKDWVGWIFKYDFDDESYIFCPSDYKTGGIELDIFENGEPWYSIDFNKEGNEITSITIWFPHSFSYYQGGYSYYPQTDTYSATAEKVVEGNYDSSDYESITKELIDTATAYCVNEFSLTPLEISELDAGY